MRCPGPAGTISRFREGRREKMREYGIRIKALMAFVAAAFVLPAVSFAIEAGVAARDYTPPVDEMRVPLGGYGDRMGKRLR